MDQRTNELRMIEENAIRDEYANGMRQVFAGFFDDLRRNEEGDGEIDPRGRFVEAVDRLRRTRAQALAIIRGDDA